MQPSVPEGAVAVQYLWCGKAGCQCSCGGALHGPAFLRLVRTRGVDRWIPMEKEEVAALFTAMQDRRLEEDRARHESIIRRREQLRARVLRKYGGARTQPVRRET